MTSCPAAAIEPWTGLVQESEALVLITVQTWAGSFAVQHCGTYINQMPCRLKQLEKHFVNTFHKQARCVSQPGGHYPPVAHPATACANLHLCTFAS